MGTFYVISVVLNRYFDMLTLGFSPQNGKLQMRRLAFSPDNRSLLVTTNKVKSIKGLIKYAMASKNEISAKAIDITTIDHIQLGQTTKRFVLARQMEQEAKDARILKEDAASLSIIYRVCSGSSILENLAPSKESKTWESLDLIVPSASDLEQLLDALNVLIEANREARRSHDRHVQLLQFHWIDLGLNLKETMSSSAWISLCDRLNVPLKKERLSAIFREMVQELELEEERLEFWSVVEIMNDLRFFCAKEMGITRSSQDPMLRVWEEIVKTDPVPALKVANGNEGGLEMDVEKDEDNVTISSVGLLTFVRTQQKEYNTTLESVQDMITVVNDLIDANPNEKKINAEDEALTKERLSKSRFFSYLLSDSNDLMDPAKGNYGSTNMKQPLSHYWINTSHDTFISKAPSKTKKEYQLDEQMYTSALYRGVRCIEMDLFDGTDDRPVIARFEPQSPEDPCLDVANVLKIIRSFLLEHPNSYPVILNIENHCSFDVQRTFSEIIENVLGSKGLLAKPKTETKVLPSPASMIGKVLLMGKRPKEIRQGAKVINDDFDDENDEYHDDAVANKIVDPERDDDIEDDDENVVIGFDASGPVRAKNSENVVRHSASELLYLVQQELEKLRKDAAQAEMDALAAEEEATNSHEHADKLLANVGLSREEVEALAKKHETEELNPSDLVELFDRRDGEGVEIQDFFGDTVEDARSKFSQADKLAIEAATEATKALQTLNEATDRLRRAEKELEEYRSEEQSVISSFQRAAANARNKTEYAETAQRRVETVRSLLAECEDNAASAENVVVTAMTESKISEKRASETESRATRASAAAKKDREKADQETRKEELLEKEASDLHEEVTVLKGVLQASKDKLEKAGGMLERVNEQVRLIESSNQYKKEIREAQDHAHEEKSETKPKPSGKFIEKHDAKLEEREMCKDLIKKASGEVSAVERKLEIVHSQFEEKAHLWKRQADLASQARKQADRSAHTAEDLAEHAEEEREAANLRHVAHERARSNVTERDSYKESLKEQLVEAERAALEADRLAVEARSEADRLANNADKLVGHSELVQRFESLKQDRDEASKHYIQINAKKEAADVQAAAAKRQFEDSNAVLSTAVQSAEQEMTQVQSQKVAGRNAIIAFNRSILARKKAEHTLEVARLAQSNVSEKESALKQAIEYKEKDDKISEIPMSLAAQVLLSKSKHRYWKKSLASSATNSHSFSHGVLDQMIELDPQHPKKLKSFTKDHICRIFPSRSSDDFNATRNFDPLLPWSLGCQLVSLNYNYPEDASITKVDGRFRENGSCGYVLKPDFLTVNPSMHERQEFWRFNVLCGSYIPSPPSHGRKIGLSVSSINPFVKICVYEGSPGKQQIYEHQTPAVKKNGFNPIWDDKRDFDVAVANPSLSIVVFSVWHKAENGSEELIGSSTLPMSCLREGYRSVQLFDCDHTRPGSYAYGSILVRAQRNAAA